MIHTIESDILTTEKTILVQQVNCRGLMGAGLAAQIEKAHPGVKAAYQQYLAEHGEHVLGHVHYVQVNPNRVIANIFGQKGVRKHKWDRNRYTHIPALLKGLEQVKEYAQENGLSIAIPYEIGCGLANGNWGQIQPLIEELFSDNKVDVVFHRL